MLVQHRRETFRTVCLGCGRCADVVESAAEAEVFMLCRHCGAESTFHWNGREFVREHLLGEGEADPPGLVLHRPVTYAWLAERLVPDEVVAWRKVNYDQSLRPEDIPDRPTADGVRVFYEIGLSPAGRPEEKTGLVVIPATGPNPAWDPRWFIPDPPGETEHAHA